MPREPPAPVSPELQRWVTSVRARPKREPAPSPELWNAPKLDAAASLARELHRSGNRVRKWVTHIQGEHAEPTTSTEHSEEVTFHVVARAVPPSLLTEALDDESDASGDPIADEKKYQNLITFVRTFTPFFSTRAGICGGNDTPARVFLGDTKGESPLEGLDEDNQSNDHGKKDEKDDANENKNNILPSDVTCRGLRLALSDSKEGERFLCRVHPEYAYLDPTHGDVLVPKELVVGSNLVKVFPTPPKGVNSEDVLFFEIEVLKRQVVTAVRNISMGNYSYRTPPTFPTPFATKQTPQPGSGWETPRAPFSVTIEVTGGACQNSETVFGTKNTVTFTSGDGSIPPELDATVCTMRLGEEALVYVPPRREGVGVPDKATQGTKQLKNLEFENKCGVEFWVKLKAMKHVRDVFGDGVVFKERVKEGSGEFPVDCPVRDCEVAVRFTVRGIAMGDADGASETSDTERDTSLEGDDSEKRSDTLFANHLSLPGFVFDSGMDPISVRLGCGELPSCLETSVRLMVPGEVSKVTFYNVDDPKNKRHGYEGLEGNSAIGKQAVTKFLKDNNNSDKSNLEFLVQLYSFQKPVNWYKAEFGEMLGEADNVRVEGNELFKKGQTQLAVTKYEKALRDLQSLRGLDVEEFDRVQELKTTLTLNLTLAWQRLNEHGKALEKLNGILDDVEVDTQQSSDTNNPSRVKALWRRGVSLSATHEYEDARRDFETVRILDKTLEEDVARELSKIDRAIQFNLKKEKKMNESALR